MKSSLNREMMAHTHPSRPNTVIGSYNYQ